jgi:large conductance mechanosensitive channel
MAARGPGSRHAPDGRAIPGTQAEEVTMDPLKTVAASQPAQRVFSLFEEFKNFAFKGNVIDLAVGVIIGAAFGKIISSLVENVIMPLVGLVLPNAKGYEGWVWTVGDKTVPYGKFLGDVVTFLIVAVSLFVFIVKFLGWVMRTRKAEAPPPLTRDQELLTQIRDLLATRQAPAQAAEAQSR